MSDEPAKLQERTFKREGERGDTIYSGRAAGSNGTKWGGQFLIIAANDEALALIWRALHRADIDPKLVYSASAIGTRHIDALVPELPTASKSE